MNPLCVMYGLCIICVLRRVLCFCCVFCAFCVVYGVFLHFFWAGVFSFFFLFWFDFFFFFFVFSGVSGYMAWIGFGVLDIGWAWIERYIPWDHSICNFFNVITLLTSLISMSIMPSFYVEYRSAISVQSTCWIYIQVTCSRHSKNEENLSLVGFFLRVIHPSRLQSFITYCKMHTLNCSVLATTRHLRAQ